MKHSKYISIGTAIAICASTAIISNSWFADSTVEPNVILLDNQHILPASGYYTRKVNCPSKKELDVYIKSTWSGLDDPYVTRIWNYDNPSESGNYFINIDQTLVNSSKFNNATASFTLNGKDKIRMNLNKNYSNIFNANIFNDQAYFVRLLVAVGSKDGKEVKEYIEVGLKIRRTGNIFDPVQAQWHIINRSPSKWTLEPFKNTLEEEESEFPEIEVPEEDNQENESGKPDIENPENQPSNPDGENTVTPGEKPENEEGENPENTENQPSNPGDENISPPLEKPEANEEDNTGITEPPKPEADKPTILPQIGMDRPPVLPKY